jgi:hypothetical protein
MFGFDDPLGIKDKNEGRDKRRSFTQSQKNQILYQQGGKCAICHKPLDPRTTQFDHKKAWADKGRTVTQNGRALHANCHAIKTHNDRLKKVDKRPSKKQQSSPLDDLLGTGGSKKKKSADPLDAFSVMPYKKGKGGFGLF